MDVASRRCGAEGFFFTQTRPANHDTGEHENAEGVAIRTRLSPFRDSPTVLAALRRQPAPITRHR